ncbi:MafI family immunity protein [Telmatocola sphagniphila]|uniref:MafI family immunity protein n=1 Tax=Telmatocola sphagniphila TaxID=1123043 RepID=A0A8E6B5C6_9BACT|nr:MafI family immunity protein [Telmatocola sphagniphila]QVL32233.1 MafI family immunity protein [Telmatocola sphagniphila]
MNHASKILEFADRFTGRLDSTLIIQALDYIRYNEEALALEILCEQLFEHEVSISADECTIAETLAMKLNIQSNAIKRLHELVQ